MKDKTDPVPKLPRKSTSRLRTPSFPAAPGDELTAPDSPYAPTPAGQDILDPPEDPDPVHDNQGDHEEGQGGNDAQDVDGYTSRMYLDALRGVADMTLIEGLGQNLRNCLKEAIDRGATPKQLLYSAKILTGGRNSLWGGLVYMGCEAFLAHLAKEAAAEADPTKVAPHL